MRVCFTFYSMKSSVDLRLIWFIRSENVTINRMMVNTKATVSVHIIMFSLFFREDTSTMSVRTSSDIRSSVKLTVI